MTITTKLILAEAQRRGWRARLLDEVNARFIEITLPNGTVRYMSGTIFDASSASGVAIALNKFATYCIAEQLNIPVANYRMYDFDQPDEVAEFCQSEWRLGHELVLKPTNCDHGIGISVGIRSIEQLEAAVHHAQSFSNKLVIQRRHYGADTRITVIDGSVVAAARRTPPYVIGDGIHDVRQLVLLENQRRAGELHKARTHKLIRIDDVERYLGVEKTAMIVPFNKRIEVSGTANFGSGGEVEDITDIIHMSYKRAAINIAQRLRLKVCGVDFMCSDSARQLHKDNTILLEINCAIGLRLHHYPTAGQPRNVVGALLDAVAKYA